MKKNNYLLFVLVIFLLNFMVACSGIKNKISEVNESKKDKKPEITLPANPVERVAIQGLINSYKNSTMWEVKEISVLKIQAMAPSGDIVSAYDPTELYCVCLEYQARYKVPWSSTDSSEWERTVRNVLVMKDQSNQYLPLRPVAICNPLCE